MPPGATSADVDETDPQYPAGYTQTEGDDPTTVTAVAGTDTRPATTAYYQPATVTGHLYIDTNGDSNQDARRAEPGQRGCVITDANGKADRRHRRLGQLDGQRAARRRHGRRG